MPAMYKRGTRWLKRQIWLPSMVLTCMLPLTPISAAELYVELLDVDAEAGFKCFEPVRFAVFVSHERDGLCGFGFTLSVIDAHGVLIPEVLADIAGDEAWRGSRGGFGPMESGVVGYIECGQRQFAASDRTPIGILNMHLLRLHGAFKLHFDDPRRRLPQSPPGESTRPHVDYGEFVEWASGRDSELYPVRCPKFIRGDTNDDQSINIADPVLILVYLFGGVDRVRCKHAADADDSGQVNVSDALYLLGYLFRNGPPPPAPFPLPGLDPQNDELPCPGFFPGAK
jgi:hypothetical protein